MPATVPDVEDQFDDEQAQVMHECPWCGSEWPSRLAAAECCSPASTLPVRRIFPCPFFHV